MLPNETLHVQTGLAKLGVAKAMIPIAMSETKNEEDTLRAAVVIFYPVIWSSDISSIMTLLKKQENGADCQRSRRSASEAGKTLPILQSLQRPDLQPNAVASARAGGHSDQYSDQYGS